MPYRRRVPRRRANVKRRPANRVAIRRIVRQTIARNTEMKTREYLPSSVGNFPAGNFSSISYGTSSIVAGLFSGIAQGIDENQRIGRKIIVKGVHIRFAIQGNDAFNHVRLMLVSPKGTMNYDTFASQSAFTQAIMNNTAPSTTQYLSPIDTNVFNVHWDRVYTTYPRETSDGVFTSVPFLIKKFIKFNKPVTWTVGNNNQAQNEVFLVGISDSVAIGHPGVITGFVRVFYTDM